MEIKKGTTVSCDCLGYNVLHSPLTTCIFVGLSDGFWDLAILLEFISREFTGDQLRMCVLTEFLQDEYSALLSKALAYVIKSHEEL